MVSQTDTLFEALAASPCRRAIACLRAHGTLTLADLTEAVIETDCETPIEDVPAETVKRRYMQLYHQHVPRLQSAGVVTYDQERDLVGLTGDAASIEPRMRQALDQLRLEQ